MNDTRGGAFGDSYSRGSNSGGGGGGGGIASGAGGMFLSALLFGYFGFIAFAPNPSLLLFQLVLWTLRIAAIAFAATGVLTVLRFRLAAPVYLLVSVLTVIMFLVLGVWHFVDPKIANQNGFLLLIFAAFNGWGVMEEIRFLRYRRAAIKRMENSP